MKKQQPTVKLNISFIALCLLLLILASCEKADKFNIEREETETTYSGMLTAIKKTLGLQADKTDSIELKKELEEELLKTMLVDRSTLEYLRLIEWANACLNTKGQNIAIDFTLEHDIDMTGLDWEPIGNWDYPYIGTFDGQGHTIKGLTMQTESDAGFFGAIGAMGVVKNLHIEGDIEGHGIIGGIVAYNKGGVISGCSFSNGRLINSSFFTIGGICGFSTAKGKISGCVVRNSFIGHKEYSANGGGIIGANSDGYVVACLVERNIMGNSISEYNAMGGIAYTNNGQIIGCITGKNKWNPVSHGIVYANKEKGVIRASVWRKNTSLKSGVGEDMNEEPQIIHYAGFYDNSALVSYIPSLNEALAINGISWRWNTAFTEEIITAPYSTR